MRLRHIALLILGCITLGAGCAHQPRAGAELGPFAREIPLELRNSPGPLWPLITPGIESRYLSSFDRSGGNSDGFTGEYSALYELPSGEQVIFDALGPGVLNTLWFTGPEEGGAGLELGKLRFYFDDEARARITTSREELFSGKRAPFLQPLVADNQTSTGGFVSWVPLPYAKRLIITTEKRPSFYIAQYDTYPLDAKLASWSAGMAEAPLAALFAQALAGPRREREERLDEVPLDYAHEGAGTLEVVRFSPTKRPSAEELQRARVQIYWDGEAQPSIDVPLGMFFGSGLGETTIRALGFQMEPGRYENRLPMPFWQRFHLRVVGLAGKLGVKIGPPRFRREEAGTLKARYRAALPTTAGRDFRWLEERGAGKLVATVLAVIPPTAETKRWWEGDLRSYADGRRTPGLHGTGHEDDHLGGWSNTFFERPFTLPLHGEPQSEIIEHAGEQYNARITLYRFWPGIHYLGALRHGLEHGNENRVQASYRGLAFYYAQSAQPRLVESDRLELGSASSRAQHRLVVEGETSSELLASAFEGEAYREVVRAQVLAHRGAARFTLRVRAANQGCYLRRMYDQRLGRQRAALAVNGQAAGDWYVAEGNPTLRWAERDYFLPAALTAGRDALHVELRPRRESPPWTAAEYRLLCVLRASEPAQR